MRLAARIGRRRGRAAARLARGMLLFALALASGCAVPTRPPAPSQQGGRGLPVLPPVPTQRELDRDTLLTAMAACHLLRVSQARDASATDTAVLAALRQFGVTAEELADRVTALVSVAGGQGRALATAGEQACERLAADTGVQSRLALPQGRGEAQVSGTWVRYEGEITLGLTAELAAHLSKERAVGLIINSPGGNVYEARKLGRYLRAKGLSVAVDRVCASACIDVLAGGVARYITPGARIGIHQSSAPGNVGSHSTGQSYVAGSALYLREMGVDPEVALAAASVPPNRMYWFSTSEAIKTGLATRLIRGI